MVWICGAGYTPARVVSTLHAHITEVLKRSGVISVLAANGAEVVDSTSEVFAAHIDAEIIRWSKLI